MILGSLQGGGDARDVPPTEGDRECSDLRVAGKRLVDAFSPGLVRNSQYALRVVDVRPQHATGAPFPLRDINAELRLEADERRNACNRS